MKQKRRKLPNRSDLGPQIPLVALKSGAGVKARVLREGLLPNQCERCGLGPVWRDGPLVMVLDHINGVANDHRLDNLRLLCPNCNSQTPTFCGRNFGKGVRDRGRMTAEERAAWTRDRRLMNLRKMVSRGDVDGIATFVSSGFVDDVVLALTEYLFVTGTSLGAIPPRTEEKTAHAVSCARAGIDLLVNQYTASHGSLVPKTISAEDLSARLLSLWSQSRITENAHA